MITEFLFSSPDGDIPLGAQDLERPFLITPSQSHPFLTLADYFNSLKAFILSETAIQSICSSREGSVNSHDLDPIEKILIRSEKHGVLYHLASVEVFSNSQRLKLAISTAISGHGRQWLDREDGILNQLNASFNLPYLPKIFYRAEVTCQRGQMCESLLMLLSEWFESFHEWHMTIDQRDNMQKICIWDHINGNRQASPKEAFEIFRQAAMILTLYYDTSNFYQIHPWHHAAGDFIVRSKEGDIDVRLTTARGYCSLMDYFSVDFVNPVIAIIYFFLNMTVRMRLDRLDGVGETTWAGDFSVEAVTRGFFDALETMEKQGRYGLVRVKDLISLLGSFKEEELEALFQPLSCLYQEDTPADYALIKENMGTHIRLLHQYLRKEVVQ
ncbi:conserved hypothetical protein [uncultured Desulfobacterium sp.]|uniref:Uncharacterized protein n=1 Tax=uncultured Desulfobacterium sp. TaxID=201089 RepID=A0A445MVX0_9BACT|nr:conserved hypothetical protein [uncultured Desulfobacterium sp.]